jgi:hypothetical protein
MITFPEKECEGNSNIHIEPTSAEGLVTPLETTWWSVSLIVHTMRPWAPLTWKQGRADLMRFPVSSHFTHSVESPTDARSQRRMSGNNRHSHPNFNPDMTSEAQSR